MVSIRNLLVLALFFVLVQLTVATSASFTVRGDEEVTRVLKLAVEDHVFIKFTVVGGIIHFYLEYPNGTVRDFGNLGDFRYTFVCDVEGDYILHFSNVGSSGDKLVTLDYEVEHCIFGIPQMLFLTLMIVAVCVIAVASFVLLGKNRL
ncbi:MAG: hypothetical protein ACUVQX_06310 [Candidatus Bathycorpusculaceae bacterium]